MDEVLHYLTLKNQYYEKFYNVTLKFIELANQNNWDEIELFVDNRERILNIIHSFDYKISQLFQELKMSKDELDSYREQVQLIMGARRTIADKIVEADLELISKMDEMKTETIRELKKTLETSHQINSFSSVKRQVKQRSNA
jgi:hypothetical protein